jgi:hypothetical protein
LAPLDDYTQPENAGRTDPSTVKTPWNEVVLGHDGGPVYPRRSRYVHLQPKALNPWRFISRKIRSLPQRVPSRRSIAWIRRHP